jgi:hypothetical protein
MGLYDYFTKNKNNSFSLLPETPLFDTADPSSGIVSPESGYSVTDGIDTSFLDSIDLTKGVPWYQNSGLLSGYAGLGSAIASLASLPSSIKYANAQTDALEQNLATARQEQSRRNKNISGFNSINASRYV